MALIFETITSDLVAFLFTLFVGVFIYIKHTYSYWIRRNVKYLKPTFPFGNIGQSLMLKRSMGEQIQKIYNETNEPFIGIYSALRPTLLFCNPELIRNVLITDFQYFSDRGFYFDEKHDPLSAHLLVLNGKKWKNLRTKLSPIFTSGKLKAMFSTLMDCGLRLQKYMEPIAKNEDVVEVGEFTARYTTDIIASVAFGIEVNSIENPDTEFRRYGRKVFEMNWKNGLRALATIMVPRIQHIFKFKSVDDDVEDFMITTVRKNLEYREKHKISRKDLFQLLIQLRNTGSVKADGKWDTEITENEKNKNFSINEVAAQCWIFYLASFETSSSTMSFVLYELARNQDIQRKVQQEIDEVTQQHNDQITYETISKMKYLESCIDETLRKYPIVPFLSRECTKEYQIPGTDIVIEKGTPIIIPVLGVQRDPRYYREPNKFIPERFSLKNKMNKSFVDMPYMAFGDGPRNCIGIRLGKMQSKLGLVLMLQKFNYSLAENTIAELKFSPKQFILAPISGFNLRITQR